MAVGWGRKERRESSKKKKKEVWVGKEQKHNRPVSLLVWTFVVVSTPVFAERERVCVGGEGGGGRVVPILAADRLIDGRAVNRPAGGPARHHCRQGHALPPPLVSQLPLQQCPSIS